MNNENDELIYLVLAGDDTSEEKVTEYAKKLDEALEKQTPKKVVEKKTWVGDYICPTCNAVFMTDKEGLFGSRTNYCGNCGQKLDWGVEK